MKKFLRPRTVLAAVLFALLAFLLGAVLWNRGHARYEALPEADRFMLDEWNTYHQGTADQDLWEGFQLRERSILALNGSSGVGYLIQPSQPVRNPLAAKLAMPDGFAAEVYRISLDPLRHDVQILLCVRQERRAVCAARQQGVLEVGKDLVLLVQQLPAVCRQPLHGVGAARGPAVLHIVVERLVAQKGDEM